MNKTNIEWTDYSWNPLIGLCPVACWYCYGRAIYKRFKIMEKPQNQGADLFLASRKEITAPVRLRKPSKIFVCSTYELFHPKVLKWFRDEIFETIEACPQHTFQILTKMPENIDRPMPDNVWLGVSITGEEDEIDAERMFTLLNHSASVKFISIEPLLGSIDEEILSECFAIDWIIIGKLTGHGKKYDPEWKMIHEILEFTDKYKTPIFLKNNLKDIWGEDLIQEYPK